MPQTYDQFVDRYGGIYENSTWVAEETYAAAADVWDAGQLANIFASCVDEAAHDRKLTLIRAHPDLAGKAAIAGDLTEESNDEQSSAGIDRCTSEEYAQFQLLNAQYLEKFDFPFVMAVRNSNRGDILRTFAQRLKNGDKTEFATAIAEIHKIARLRLAVMDKP
ncbi:MAG: 2-oxo-4-hydroxy-4-carboxy-5-ureidoimidazoline decarboxylase [Gammaproteobacteria bacterium]|nr:MAG: 2-oxo-4-hydroxy-4-carboxy-5-ureidoimidazoline decarboxylase [Gammaproteobacteria bacterium]